MLKIPNFSTYLITTSGDIFSTRPFRNFAKLKEPHKIKPTIDKDGYLKVILVDDSGKRKTKRVHILVANTYLENPEKHPFVLHKDGSKNTELSNLYWGTAKQNSEDSKKHNTWIHGEKVNTCKLKKGQVLSILNQDKQKVNILAKQYGVSIGTIYKIRSREIWKSVSP